MNLKKSIREIGFRVAPKPTLEFLSWRSQRLIMKIEERTGRLDVSRSFCKRHGTAVLHGPFKGMQYPDWIAAKRNLIPKLVASYEDELHDWIAKSIQSNYETIVNVGSADGYYTVGFALRCPGSEVIGFDTDLWARKATSSLATNNNASNVRMLSMCTSQWLQDNLPQNSLLIIDCEGFEKELLDVRQAPNILNSDVLVELHEHVAPGVGKMVENGFADTHKISVIDAVLAKNPDDYAELSDVEPAMRKDVISEGRHGPQSWLFLTRRSGPGASEEV
jgi:precorrin-6B methylase 2